MGVLVEAELVALASSGAGTLVTLMVTDAWGDVKAKVAALFARRRGGEAVAHDLEEGRAALIAARQRGDEQAAADVQAKWRSRLGRLLQEDPEAKPLLAELVAQYAPQVARASTSTEIRDNTFQGPVAINSGSGDQTNTFGTPAS